MVGLPLLLFVTLVIFTAAFIGYLVRNELVRSRQPHHDRKPPRL